MGWTGKGHILSFELDLSKDLRFRNPLELARYVRSIIEGKDEQFYLFVDEIRMHPLSFSEYYSVVAGDKQDAFDAYTFYGGMPLILSRPGDDAKIKYLESLFSEVYIKDIVERKKVQLEDILSLILDELSSSIGSLTNPSKLSNAINTIQKKQR